MGPGDSMKEQANEKKAWFGVGNRYGKLVGENGGRRLGGGLELWPSCATTSPSKSNSNESLI